MIRIPQKIHPGRGQTKYQLKTLLQRHKNYMWYHRCFLPLESYHQVKFEWSDRSNYKRGLSIMFLNMQSGHSDQNCWKVVLCWSWIQDKNTAKIGEICTNDHMLQRTHHRWRGWDPFRPKVIMFFNPGEWCKNQMYLTKTGRQFGITEKVANIKVKTWLW